MRNRKRYDVERLFGNPETLLGFMRRTRKPVFHKSNIFFRDVQYAIRDYFDSVEARPITIPQAEEMARHVIELYMEVGLLRKVADQTYLLDAPEFATPEGGTYSMLTIHGAPLPAQVETWLEISTAGTSADPAFREDEKEYKGGDVSPDGATIAELLLPITPPESGESGHGEGRNRYEDIGTAEGPQSPTLPEVQAAIEEEESKPERQIEESERNNAVPPWLQE